MNSFILLCRKESFDAVSEWYEQVKLYGENFTPIFLAGNQIDKVGE